MTAILGLSAFYHDSAAALVVDGEIVAAAQEERFTRKKHDHEFPTNAVNYCLEAARLAPEQLDYVGFYDKPLLKFDRLLETYLSFAPAGLPSFRLAMPLWLEQKLHLPREMSKALGGRYKKSYVFTEHHESHAASAFFPSPFDQAAILTMDGVGEWATASFGTGEGNKIRLTHELRFPHSLGLLYSAFTYYCGFEVNSGEYKLMGLAPYGEPRFKDLILEKLLDVKPDGSFRMDLSYFNYCQGLTMTSPKFDALFGGPARRGEPVTDRHMDIAASIQQVTEEIVMRMARHVHERTGLRNLCLAGGVALNCVANGRLLREGPFDDVWVQPAAGDAGGALGVALFIWHQLLDYPRVATPGDSQRGSLLGPAYRDEQIRQFLDSVGAAYDLIPDDSVLHESIAERLADGQVIGFLQGAMEFGPRALGARSLLGDPRNPAMQAEMNLKVKFRESFRPFAPAVLREHVHEWFGTRTAEDSPYMLFVAPVNAEHRRQLTDEDRSRKGIDKLMTLRSSVPAITHVDYSARIQTVDAQRHGPYHGVIDAFYRRTGCPVIVNTSFNLGWDPIVCTPADAYHTFMASEIDALCMGHYVLPKRAQPAEVRVAAAQGAGFFSHDPWCCPCGREAVLERDGASLRCPACTRTYPTLDGVPQLLLPHEGADAAVDLTRRVEEFHDEHVYPTYDGYESLRTLIDFCRRDRVGRMLDANLPYNARVLEVGCGSGHLSNFLGIACREVIGIDVSQKGLAKAEEFRTMYDLRRVKFARMDLFAPGFKSGQFDVIVCNGVLHHTHDPQAALARLAKLLTPGGTVVLALNHSYGRVPIALRKALFSVTGGRPASLDPTLARTKPGSRSRQAVYARRYRHPHETAHTVAEVRGWFAHSGLDFVRAVPGAGATPKAGDLLREPSAAGKDGAGFSEWGQAFNGDKDSGSFLVVGRRRADGSNPTMRKAG
jgi:carbamoyltransferase